MAIELRNKQRGILPNIPVLRKLIPWFDAVSNFIDAFLVNNPTFKAGAYVSGNVFINQSGFNEPITHPGAGIYECFFTVPIDAVTNYWGQVCLANLGAGDAVLFDIGLQIVDTTRIRIRVYSLADTAGPTAPALTDHDFYVRIERRPGV